ncbi:LOW QUALITY PROTEIN: hypothetical protein Cgig2_017935 [Carnegiea gigantea]|uniref:Photosystem II protein D1 n=1 Tax=Carnegiea gigantea TaxID=171969 RepID=A0A9Q1QEY6_9CARY|nr:LOW QUALITY PROTEIN: hypothetical protein Cgig2_017935 [Carnegiea gigantea]
MIPTLLTTTTLFIIAFIAAPPIDINGIGEPIFGSLLYKNNIISGAIIPTSVAIGFHFYPIWEAASVDEWLYNGGPYKLILLHFLLGLVIWIMSGNLVFIWVCVLRLLLHIQLRLQWLSLETTKNKSANEGYKFGQEEETYNIVAAHGHFGQLIFQYASFNNSCSLHFLLAAWPVMRIWFTTLCISTMAFSLNDRVINTWLDIIDRANLGMEVTHERNTHNFPLDPAAIEALSTNG